MRWAPFHPRQLMVVALTTFAMMLMLMLAAPPDLGTLDFGGGGSGSEGAGPAPAAASEGAARTPAWVEDPLAPPLVSLGPRAG